MAVGCGWKHGLAVGRTVLRLECWIGYSVVCGLCVRWLLLLVVISWWFDLLAFVVLCGCGLGIVGSFVLRWRVIGLLVIWLVRWCLWYSG